MDASGDVAGSSMDQVSPDAAEASRPQRCEPHEPRCQSESIEQLPLLIEPSSGSIVTEGELTVVDARAGGQTPSESFVYARFTDRGLVQVMLDDEASLRSLDWDIAFRRLVIRLNSGVSGPSCVEATEGPEGVRYDDLTRVLPGTSYRYEGYFTTPSCRLVDDGTLGVPGTVMQGFWSFVGCLRMTGEVYLVRLRDDRVVKLQVMSYYDPEVQVQCDRDFRVPMRDNGSGVLRLRWSFMPQ